MSTTPNPATITYEQLMASFLELRERMAEASKETDRKFQETARQMKETDRKMKETDRQMKETARKIKETNEQIGKLGDRLGELVQAMVEGGIIRMFKGLGYDFDLINSKHCFGNKELNIYGEVDVLLENGDYALLVEVKTNLSVDDIRKHLKTLQKFRQVADAKNDKRRFIAAVGGGVVRKNVREFALKQGMFVVQQSGENVEILVPKGKPKVW